MNTGYDLVIKILHLIQILWYASKHHYIEFIKDNHTVAEYTWFHIPRAGHLSLIEIYAHKDKMKDNSV